jgi:hypothetical protein
MDLLKLQDDESKLLAIFMLCVAAAFISVVVGVTIYQVKALEYKPPETTVKEVR